jgi:transposase
MHGSILVLAPRVKKELRWLRRGTREAGLAMRCQVILLAAKGCSSRGIAEAVGCDRSWASRVIQRFIACGPLGLLDRREDNGIPKLTEAYLGRLVEVVEQTPLDFGFPRPTWTRELLVIVMQRQTGVRIHVATMSRALKLIRARRARPRPTVGCPWPEARKNRHLRRLRRMVEHPRSGEVWVYVDEVDIHLNPKIGLDWQNCGQQKQVLTPGQNMKRYLAGAWNAHSGRLTCVEAGRKNSALVIGLLDALAQDYADARVIHVILDNFRIHHSRITQAALRRHGGRIRLHFLPPYCPNDNRIERLWLDLHAQVTRNHQKASLDELMHEVWRFVRRRAGSHRTRVRRVAA